MASHVRRTEARLFFVLAVRIIPPGELLGRAGAYINTKAFAVYERAFPLEFAFAGDFALIRDIGNVLGYLYVLISPTLRTIHFQVLDQLRVGSLITSAVAAGRSVRP